MDEKTVRRLLGEANATLTKLEAEREVQLQLVRAYEAWLDVYAFERGMPPQPPLPLAALQSTAPSTDQRVELRPTLLRVLKDARGAPLHVREILTRAQQRGASTTAKDPLSAIDVALYSLREQQGAPIEKVRARTWRWMAEGGAPPELTADGRVLDMPGVKFKQGEVQD